MKKQFTIRAAIIVTSVLCVYLGFARSFGFGRAILCCFTLLQGVSSLVFFVASYHSWKGEHPRNACAAFLLAVMILAGTLLLAYLVFQPVARTTTPFDALR